MQSSCGLLGACFKFQQAIDNNSSTMHFSKKMMCKKISQTLSAIHAFQQTRSSYTFFVKKKK
jgi:hypothetical protein